VTEEKEYRPLSMLDITVANVYSDYTPVNTPLSVALKVSFPDGTMLTGSDTVLQYVGIEYYIRSGADGYILYSTGSMLV
jgi:hypothetical protein